MFDWALNMPPSLNAVIFIHIVAPFFCNFIPEPSLRVFREDKSTPWSWSFLVKLDKKVASHSKNPCLQHFLFLSPFLDITTLSMSTTFFPCTARLGYFLSIDCFLLVYDLNNFKSRINGHLLTVDYF